MFEIDRVAEEKKRHKLTDAEYSSLPSYISIYAEQGDQIPKSLIKDWRKDNPRQLTALDTSRVEIIDKSGKRTGKFLEYSKTTPADIRAKRSRVELNIERIAKAQTEQPKSPEQIYRDTIGERVTRLGKIGTVRRGFVKDKDEEADFAEVIEILDEKIIDVTQDIYNAKDALRKTQGKLSQAKTVDIVKIYNKIEEVLGLGLSPIGIEKALKKKYNLTIEELSQLYKANQ